MRMMLMIVGSVVVPSIPAGGLVLGRGSGLLRVVRLGGHGMFSCTVTHLLLLYRIPCGGKPIRTISGVSGINQQIRIRISSLRNVFLNDSNFLVCSKFKHAQCGRTCACAVACLYPHNSNSNVVVSLLNSR